MKATAEIKYYTTEKAGGCLSGVAGSGDGVCRVSSSLHEAGNELKS